MEKIKDQFTGRRFKGGAYATLISFIVIAVVIAINLIVGELGISKDITASAKYSLLDETKEFMKGIDDKITLYYLVPNDTPFDYYDMKLFSEQFNSVTDNIKIEEKDPVKYPKFASQYTDESVSEYSFIVVNETNGRVKYIDVYDYVQTDMDYNTYQTYISAIDLEGQLVSALQYVTTDNVPKMYVVTGHGEAEVTAALASGIAKENVETENIVLLTAGEIPSDCDILFINNPAHDFSEDEVKLVRDYLAAGGNVIAIFSSYTPNQQNLTALLGYYGMKLTENMVFEGDTRYYAMRSPLYLVPGMAKHDITTGLDGNTYAFCPDSNGIMFNDDARRTITFTPLLITSKSSFAKQQIADTYEKEEGDTDGPFALATIASEEYNGVTSNFVVISCPYFLDDSLISYGTYANGNLFYNTLNYLADIETAVSVRAVSLMDQSVQINEAQGNTFGIVYIFLIPLVIIGLGIFVTVRRRRL